MYSSYVKHVIVFMSGSITSLDCGKIANGVNGIVRHNAIADNFR